MTAGPAVELDPDDPHVARLDTEWAGGTTAVRQLDIRHDLDVLFAILNRLQPGDHVERDGGTHTIDRTT